MPAGAAEPSRFWSQFGAQHERQPAVHGFDAFKRRQAISYLTWRWRPLHVPAPVQTRLWHAVWRAP